jgi:hypothetical protein
MLPSVPFLLSLRGRPLGKIRILSGVKSVSTGITFVGVESNNPHPLPFVGRSNVAGSNNSPSSIKPHCGKVSEHRGKSS